MALFPKMLAVVMVAVTFGVCVAATRAEAQSPTIPDWQTVAGGKMAFDVASVKQNKSGLPPSGDNPIANFALDDGNSFPSNGGLFSVTNFPMSAFISFAYKLTPSQNYSVSSQLPKWAASERFNIQARAAADTTKDQMRLMMQSLLTDRFKLAVHIETRQSPVFALVLVKPAKTGPQLRPYADDPPCLTTIPAGNQTGPPPSTDVGQFPPVCFVVGLRADRGTSRATVGSRNLSMQQIANDLPAIPTSNLDRPVIDQTGLSGNFDFTMQVTFGFGDPMSPASAPPDDSGPTFLEALRDQLGLNLESTTGPVQTLVIDHIEEPSEN